MALNPGEVIVNRYKIVKKLGSGGFGAVYLAEDLNLGEKLVALKENMVDNSDPQALARLQKQFKYEAVLLSNLNHPNLPRVTNFFLVSSTGLQYLVMDFIPGQNLASHLQNRGTLSETEAVPIMMQLLDALIYIHSQTPPIVHRDIKPPNIIITKENRVFLVDFGISKLLGGSSSIQALTPHYAPPEQYGSGTDARSDIYALGATFYTLLTGVLPSESMERLLGKVLIPPRQLKPVLSTSIENIILKAMQLQPDQRYQSAKELHDALTATFPVINGKPAPGILVQQPAPAYVSQPKVVEGKIIIVSTDGSSKYRTIKDGIAAAGPEGVVRVRPGVYSENLVINGDIKIQGDGDKRQIILEAAGNQQAIHVTGGYFQMSNISVRATQNQPTCVYLSGGTSVLTDCDLSGGDNTTVVVRGCVAGMHTCSIHGSNGNGLAYTGSSSGVVEDCEIFNNKNGVQCTDASAPTFKQCKMYQNEEAGVACFDEVKAIFEACEMFNNKNGVQCTDASAPIFRRCKMYRNQQSGVYCAVETKAVFENCEMFEHKGFGVMCYKTSAPIFRRCKMYRNQQSGVYCADETKAVFEDCEMFDTKEYYGVQCTDASAPTFKRCKMYQNLSCGVACYDEVKAIFEACEMFENKRYAVQCANTSSPTFKQCKMYHNKNVGAICFNETKAVFEECTMTGNREGNFWKADTANPSLLRCTY